VSCLSLQLGNEASPHSAFGWLGDRDQKRWTIVASRLLNPIAL